MWTSIRVITTLNLDLEASRAERKLQLSELDEIKNEPMKTLGCVRKEPNCFMANIFIRKNSF